MNVFIALKGTHFLFLFAVLGKNEYMWALILEYGIENLLRSEGVI